MKEHSESLTLQQMRNGKMKQYILFSQSKEKQAKLQNFPNFITSFKQTNGANLEQLEAQLKSLQCQQTQRYFNTRLPENIFCGYNRQKKAQSLCCSENCQKHAIMCGDQNCKCSSDHIKCSFIAIERFLDQIHKKISQPIPKQIQLYFQAKLVIFDHMLNRISQQRQALKDWQQSIGTESKKNLTLYGFDRSQAIVCQAAKVSYHQKPIIDHQQCGCVPIKITKQHVKACQLKCLKETCKSIQETYSSMIIYFNQKIDKLHYHNECVNLNPAQFWFVDFLQNKEYFSTQDPKEACSSNKGSKNNNLIPGSTIYLARHYRKKEQGNINFQKFAVNRVRKLWKNSSENLFRLFIQGKAIINLFKYMNKRSFLCLYSIQALRISIDKIVQKLNQAQQYLFSQNYLRKNKQLKNIDPKQLKTRLQKYKSLTCDEVYITNDRYRTAVIDVETIKELRNFRSVTKLVIKWCWQMKEQISIEILNIMPHLKHLALLGHSQILSQNFLKKVCLLKQLTFFYFNYSSHPDYYRCFMEDGQFINLLYLTQRFFPSAEQLLELSKLQMLKNIEITRPDHPKSRQLIQNMKQIKHLTLGNHSFIREKLFCAGAVLKQRELRIISLIGIWTQDINRLNQIIINNPHLNTIIIRDGYTIINDSTVKCMADLIQLQNLCISSNSNQILTGKHMSKLDSLIMLELSTCVRASKSEMKEAISNMSKLQHLSLEYNKWVDDDVIISVQSCRELVFLNIKSTLVSGKGLKHLKGLNRLSMLICSGTKIRGIDLIELTKNIPSMTRLGIKDLNLDDNELLQISTNCQAITHLDIRLNKITTEALLKIKRLKVIKCGLDELSKKKLRPIGIQIY